MGRIAADNGVIGKIVPVSGAQNRTAHAGLALADARFVAKALDDASSIASASLLPDQLAGAKQNCFTYPVRRSRQANRQRKQRKAEG